MSQTKRQTSKLKKTNSCFLFLVLAETFDKSVLFIFILFAIAIIIAGVTLQGIVNNEGILRTYYFISRNVCCLFLLTSNQ